MEVANKYDVQPTEWFVRREYSSGSGSPDREQYVTGTVEGTRGVRYTEMSGGKMGSGNGNVQYRDQRVNGEQKKG